LLEFQTEERYRR